MIRDCVFRVAHAAETLGIRGILVHALSESARAFYIATGFEQSAPEPMVLMANLADITFPKRT